MMAADSLHANVHHIVPSGVSFRWLWRCRRECSADASVPHFALSLSPPGRRCRERERQAKTEGKTKGGGTSPPAKPVCTWGWYGTARLCRRAAWGARPAPMLICPCASHDQTRFNFPKGQP